VRQGETCWLLSLFGIRKNEIIPYTTPPLLGLIFQHSFDYTNSPFECQMYKAIEIAMTTDRCEVLNESWRSSSTSSNSKAFRTIFFFSR
jgi:hypothetical protein